MASAAPAPVPNCIAFATTLTRGKVDEKDKTSNAGVLHRLSLNPCREDVYLIALSFLGLPQSHKAASEQAIVSIDITESGIFRKVWEYQYLKNIFKEQQFCIDFHREKDAVLELPYPVILKKGTWVDIAFEIKFCDNVNTKTMSMAKSSMDIWPPTWYTDDGFVRFDMTRGKFPLQMHKLHFLLK